jgi:hypothetical protein
MKNRPERVQTSLQINEDIDFHSKGWIIQRVGWALMFIFILCAALGLFGNGVLSHRNVTKDGTTVFYERFGRHQSNTRVEIDANGRNGKIEVVLSGNFTESYKIERIVPEAAEQKIQHGSKVYVFTAEGQGHVTFFVNALKQGTITSTVAVNGTGFNLESYIYP